MFTKDKPAQKRLNSWHTNFVELGLAGQLQLSIKL